MMKRDLKADLELCNKATQGPWRHEWNPDCSEIYAPGVDTPIVLVGHDPHDADFAVQAREGWPHAIERAIEAEELSRELLKALKFFFKCLSDKDLVEPEPSHWLSLELSLIATLCHKAEEVLGDDSQGDNRAT